MITAISSRLMDTDGKLIGIGFNGNSDLGFLAMKVCELTFCFTFLVAWFLSNLLSLTNRYFFH